MTAYMEWTDAHQSLVCALAAAACILALCVAPGVI